MIIINLRGVSRKLYFNLNITMPTYKEFITKQNLYYAYFKNNMDLQYRPTETIHREASAFRVRARIIRASFERGGTRNALAIAFRVSR